MLAGPSRNFKIFGSLDFLAEVTQRIPEQGEHLIRNYGWRIDDACALASRTGERATVLPCHMAR